MSKDGNNKKESVTNDEFNILVDKPLENGDEDRFGHRDIAKSLLKIIRKSPRPFNIGLYGQWGVGKSTICKIIQESLEKDKDYEVVYFDTWKYERDSFRRQFLINLDEELDLGLNYKETLNQSLTVPVIPEWRERIKQVLDDFLFRSAFITIAILAFIILFKEVIVPLIISGEYVRIAEKLSDLGMIGIIFSFVLNSVQQLNQSKTTDKTDSAEGFEEHFIDVLENIKKDNLVVIIDNLDRLSSENAVSLLSDIKTFLSSEKYKSDGHKLRNKASFIVPCDNKAINDQLIDQYGDDFDSEEYLRKFFNHSIQIPKFLDIELDDFIVEKLNSTKIVEFADNYDLSFILNSAFRNNPREIIQFINSLTSLYLLAKERNISRVIQKEKVAFLAKVLVLRVKWPRLYDIIENQIVRTGNKLDEIVDSLVEGDSKRNLKEFLKTTARIDDEEYQDIYFSLRQSLAQQAIPEWNSFILALLENREPDAKKIYDSVRVGKKLRTLGQLLASYCRRNKNNENVLFNIFLSLHKIVDSNDVGYFQDVFFLTFDNVQTQKFVEDIDDIDLSHIFSKGLHGVSPSNKSHFANYLVEVLKHFSAIEEVSREDIAKIRELFETTNLEVNNQNFQSLQSSIGDIKRDLLGKIKYQELFPEAEKDNEFKEDILDDLLKVIVSVKPISRKHYFVALSIFGNLLQWAPIIENDTFRLKVLNESYDFLKKVAPPTSANDANEAILNTFTTRITTWYQANKVAEERNLCVKIFAKINIGINPNNEPKSSIRRFVTEISNDADEIFKTLGKDYLIDNQNARSALVDRSRTTMDLLDKLPLKKKLTPEEKAHILSNIIGSAEEALRFLDYVSYSVPKEYKNDENFLKGIIMRMINDASFSDTDLLSRWLGTISKLGLHSDQVDLFVQKLRQVRNLSDDHKKVISDFVTRNKKDFGELIVDEFKYEEDSE